MLALETAKRVKTTDVISYYAYSKHRNPALNAIVNLAYDVIISTWQVSLWQLKQQVPSFHPKMKN